MFLAEGAALILTAPPRFSVMVNEGEHVCVHLLLWRIAAGVSLM